MIHVLFYAVKLLHKYLGCRLINIIKQEQEVRPDGRELGETRTTVINVGTTSKYVFPLGCIDILLKYSISI